MTSPSTPRAARGQAVWRVQLRDRFHGRKEGWIELGPPYANGRPSYATAAGKSPMGLWTCTEAREIAARWNKPIGTRHRIEARVVKDATALEERASLRCPTGEAA